MWPRPPESASPRCPTTREQASIGRRHSYQRCVAERGLSPTDDGYIVPRHTHELLLYIAKARKDNMYRERVATSIEEFTAERISASFQGIEQCRRGGLLMSKKVTADVEVIQVRYEAVECVGEQVHNWPQAPANPGRPTRIGADVRRSSATVLSGGGREHVGTGAAGDVIPKRDDRSDGSGALPEPSEQRRPCG